MDNRAFSKIWILVVVVVIAAGILAWQFGAKPSAPSEQIAVRQSGGAGLLAAECADRDYIASTSDYIIEGTVEKVESKWNQEKTLISTYTDLAIEKYLKGTPFTEPELQIVTPGGRVGERGLWVEDQPIFHEGKKVRIYFRATNGEFSIVCAQSGVEEVSPPIY